MMVASLAEWDNLGKMVSRGSGSCRGYFAIGLVLDRGEGGKKAMDKAGMGVTMKASAL